MTVKEHYDNHLGPVYSWMSGDFRAGAEEFKAFLEDNAIQPGANRVAIDLGAGHGIQSIPLAEKGFKVMAIDFNQQLLDELKSNAKDLNISTIHDDIKKVRAFADKPELVVCCGDTLLHLSSKQEVESLIADISDSLDYHGKFILSFRDYSTPLTGTERFIPVQSDDRKILTCILDYETGFVQVTDLLYEKTNDVWTQKVSAYKKVRLYPTEIINILEANGLKITFRQTTSRWTTIIAMKDREKKQQTAVHT